MAQEKLFTIDQIASYLQIDKFTVYRLVNLGKLPAYKVGSQWRFDRREVLEKLRKTSSKLIKKRALEKSGKVIHLPRRQRQA